MIYIIEDDKEVRDAYLMLLKSSGYSCRSFDNAEEFISKFKCGLADFLILDLQLTGMNGCSLLKSLSGKGIHLPVIVITAFDSADYRECCKDYGVIAYLRKPVDGRALIDLIKYNTEDQANTKDKNSFHNHHRSTI